MHASSSYEDMEAGVRFLRRAADAGVPRAMYVLGMCLQRGFGTPRDPEEARVCVADPKVERVEVFEAELEGPVRVGMGTTAKAELLKAVAAEALAATGGSALGVSVAPLVEVRKEEKGVEAAAVEDGSSLMDMEREGVEPVAETLPDPLVDVQQENSLIPSVSANKESATPSIPQCTIATPQLPQANLYPYPFFSAPIDIVEVFAPQKEDDDELYHFTLVPPAL
ncbi:hypothetical protein BC829DRAFT_390879 [Chytridium lagenaria]|nr:hypothetical protein BC829DRAFT_390879 [Chytridium lagenaria]